MPIRSGGADCSCAAIADVWKREIGQISSIGFSRRRAASEDLVLRLDIQRKLHKHHGCVNTISFNESGDVLVSGSDDRRVILWDWESGKVRLSFHSGHHNNVFQAKIMPCSEDRSIVTCAADGQVRHAQVREGGVQTKFLAQHHGRVHKLAIEPGNPHTVYTCGEDALVQHIDLRTEKATSMFTCASQLCHSFLPVNLNAITINPRNPNLFAVGGGDQFARLFDIRKYNWDGSSDFGQPVDHFCPPHLVDDEQVGITGLAFSDQSELLVSYNEEFIYLFTKNTGLGPQPTVTSQALDDSSRVDVDDSSSSMNAHTNIEDGMCYKGHKNSETVKGVNFFGPRCEYVVSGSDCGRIFIWNKKRGELIRVMEADKHIVNCTEGHPHATVLASSGIEDDIKIWTPRAVNRASLPSSIEKDGVLSWVRGRTGFIPFGGFFEACDDFIGTDDEEDNDDWNIDDDDDNEEEEDDEDGSNDNDSDCGSSGGDSQYNENETSSMNDEMVIREDNNEACGPSSHVQSRDATHKVGLAHPHEDQIQDLTRPDADLIGTDAPDADEM